MVDTLDRQILEVISKAASLVRTVTRREVETGILFPSVTAVDIKRNLRSEVQLNVIESRLSNLAREGYIYYDGGRWWLTRKGQLEVGGVCVHEASVDVAEKPISRILEETFSKYGAGGNDLLEAILSRLDEIYTNTNLTREERIRNVREILSKFFVESESVKRDLRLKCDELSIEVKKLEDELEKKRSELKKILELLG
jgi:hypothetical protein